MLLQFFQFGLVAVGIGFGVEHPHQHVLLVHVPDPDTGGYEVIPREAALKIQERDPQRIVQLNVQTEEAAAEDDPYAAYKIPDDLMW